MRSRRVHEYEQCLEFDPAGTRALMPGPLEVARVTARAAMLEARTAARHVRAVDRDLVEDARARAALEPVRRDLRSAQRVGEAGDGALECLGGHSAFPSGCMRAG